MVLLFSATLQPKGPAGLAAVRFSAPISIAFIRIFPNGVPFFASNPHITSKTQPDAFYLDIFFNAIQKDKSRPANALLPTSISYPGGLMDFAVDMGSENATRLMIVKGLFDHLSLAIYGTLLSSPPPVLVYQPSASITLPDPQPLSPHLNPAQASDPTALANSLLALIPNAPSLPLALRLMFCLKPSEDDWENPDFPHIYANLDNDSEDYDLDSIVDNLHHPIPEDERTFDRFLDRLADFVGPPSVDQAYQIANALNLSASQNPLFSQALLNALDFQSIFTATTLSDPPTLTTLTDACANPLIARHFASQTPLLAILSELRHNLRSRSDRALLTALDRLNTRILGWQALDDNLFSPSHETEQDKDWSQAVSLIYAICREEQALGNWLASMITHEDILTTLSQTPILSEHERPPVMFTHSPIEGDEDDDEEEERIPVTHVEFISFVRACVGVASVLGVLAWADSVGNDDCRERALAVIQLWQGIEGYREIVNHLFLLRQLTRRLKWITTDNDPPRHSGLLAERVLCSLLLPPVLTTSPISSSSSQHHPVMLPALNLDLTQTVLSLSQPLAYIPEHERLCFRKLALVVDDGLPAAVEELVVMFESLASEAATAVTTTIRKPISLRRVRILRVGVGLVLRELEAPNEAGAGEQQQQQQRWDTDTDGGGTGGEWRILEAFNTERTYGFTERLVDLFVDLVEDLTHHFSQHLFVNPTSTSVQQSSTTTTTTTLNRELVEQLFATTRELLSLIYLLIPTFSITARGLRKIVSGIVDLVGCSDWVFKIHPDKSIMMAVPINGSGGGGENGHEMKNGCVIGRKRQTDLQRVATKTRRTCLRVLKNIVSSNREVVEPRKKRCKEEVAFRTLLMCGQTGGESDTGQGMTTTKSWDIIGRLQKILELIEIVLPLSPNQQEKQFHWAINVFPLVLHDLRLFIKLLPVESQVRILEILVYVDENGGGDVGVGEWLVEEEVKEVGDVLRGLVGSDDSGEGLGEFEGKVEGPMEGVEGEKDKVEEESEKKRREREVWRAERKVNQYRIYVGLQFLWLLASSSSHENSAWLVNALSRTPTLSVYLTQLFTNLLTTHYTTPPFISLLKFFSQPTSFGKLDEELKVVVFLGVLRIGQGDVTDMSAGDWVGEMIKDESVKKKLLFSSSLENESSGGGGEEYMDVLRLEVGRLCAVCADRVGAVSVQVAEMVLDVLEWMGGVRVEEEEGADMDDMDRIGTGSTSKGAREERNDKLKILKGITPEAFNVLCDSLTMILPSTREESISTVRKIFTVDHDEDIIPIPTELPDTLVLSLSNISTLLARSRPPTTSTTTATTANHSHTRTGSLSTLTTDITMSSASMGDSGAERPTTPKGTKTPDILGTIISPPTALLRSPAATGLTKTYANNDFRQLRQVPSARLNTSRLPSMHVDDFESGGAVGPGAAVPVGSVSPLIVPVPIPIADVSAFGGLLNMGQ